MSSRWKRSGSSCRMRWNTVVCRSIARAVSTSRTSISSSTTCGHAGYLKSACWLAADQASISCMNRQLQGAAGTRFAQAQFEKRNRFQGLDTETHAASTDRSTGLHRTLSSEKVPSGVHQHPAAGVSKAVGPEKGRCTYKQPQEASPVSERACS